MKMEEKQCTRCRQPLSLECFRISKPTGQLTKCLVKCLEKSKQQTKCKHKGQISYWKDCGGSQICEHNKQRSKCKDCDGSQICEHNKRRSECSTCDPIGHLAGVLRGRVFIALKNNKEIGSTEYLGCNIETFKNT